MQKESGFAWLVGRWWFWTAAVVLLFAQPLVRTLLREPPHLPPKLAVLPSSRLRAELRGKTWIAGFHASSAELLRLHRRLRKLGDTFRIVVLDDASPSHDPLAPLSAVIDGKSTRINARVWRWVGDNPATPELCRALALAPGTAAVIDADGQLRGRHSLGVKADEDALVADVGLLVNNY
jgi:hypothetical protein